MRHRAAIRIRYDEEVDALYVQLGASKIVESDEIKPGIIVDFNAKNEAVGIEVLDSRYTNYKFTMPDVVADNTSAGRYVVGSAVPAAGLDLRLLGVVLEHNGEVVATASGAAALGHPAAAVDEGLRAGDIVLSGGLTAAVPVKPGDVVTATADRLGSVELACV